MTGTMPEDPVIGNEAGVLPAAAVTDGSGPAMAAPTRAPLDGELADISHRKRSRESTEESEGSDSAGDFPTIVDRSDSGPSPLLSSLANLSPLCEDELSDSSGMIDGQGSDSRMELVRGHLAALFLSAARPTLANSPVCYHPLVSTML